MSTILLGILMGAAAIAALFYKAFSAGKKVQSAEDLRGKADSYEKEIERIGRAADARASAERDARGGMLDDEWTRD
ncbi:MULTISPECIES: hypothetical protein [Brucella]|uniref:Uncharacterized protein n=1 Tax=Brucella intermedia M86 TaxID=1234597 RepID=M5JLR2_9HYPH|nr:MULTISPECIES: hypothetical protein [Brucella]ELT47725.1 hypothetical protein D584_18072 [Brucella intermedia M86]UVV66779.1 hypothetical protein NW321_09845 [Brucella anthropi]